MNRPELLCVSLVGMLLGTRESRRAWPRRLLRRRPRYE